MNYLELNYISNGSIDSVKIGDYSSSLLALYNRYFSELGKDEQQIDRMNSILLYNYNFDNEFERLIFSELIFDAVSRINYVVSNYLKLTQEKVNQFTSTLGSIGGNTDMLLHFLEHKIEMDREFKPEIKVLLGKFSSFISANQQLNLTLKINDSVSQQNFEQSEVFLNRMIKEVKSQNGGCYIATMAYGDYDHPQVLKLRYFRDDYLSKTLIGRSFIKFYYFISPKLVQVFQNKKGLNHFIRKSLDVFIKIISK